MRTIKKILEHFYYSNLGLAYNETLPFEQVQLMAEMSGCRAHRKVVKDCSGCYHKKYRTFDGTCNHLKRPMQGASYTPLRRILSAEYEDGLTQPIGNLPQGYLIMPYFSTGHICNIGRCI